MHPQTVLAEAFVAYAEALLIQPSHVTRDGDSLLGAEYHQGERSSIAQHISSGTIATGEAMRCSHRVRPQVLWQHFGHSGAMPAASTGETQRPTACSRRPQR